MKTASHLSQVYRPDFGMLTDLYQLTMAAGYYQQRMHERKAIFHLFFRKAPFGGDFAVAAGLALAIELVKGLHFSADDVQYLGRLRGMNGGPLFKEPFLNYLQRMKFTGTIHAVPEGEIALPHEPLLRIEAPLIQAQLLETALLTVINFSTLIATKAARIKEAAGDDTVLEFGLRRAQGIDGGLTASRSAYIGGCDATSNVWAGRYYDIPVKGTHAHAWVMAFPSELESFEAYAEAMPNNSTFLVDTYDTLAGVKRAMQVGRKLRERGHEMLGIRLDSGDLADLSIKSRALLDAGGFPDAKIVASDSLDEYAVRDLKARGAKIDVWGIGTNLVTAKDQPALGGVYKLAALQNEDGSWTPKIKRSETAIKTSNPGKLNVRRFTNSTGQPVGSILYDELQPVAKDPSAYVKGEAEARMPRLSAGLAGASRVQGGELRSKELLAPVFVDGELVYDLPELPAIRELALRNWKLWSEAGEVGYGLSPALYEQKLALLEEYVGERGTMIFNDLGQGF
ncbi:nicotinate phosphoribosyltransferase [Neolewinella antarctica]|uniref:Nicotinate phosphoribosyltransferase n=1 Tax=Neolewinella antarctica TaxID=442734 RepID=A0ABX0X993_9BACT|nr:nicotinate phosphoribosyltransferase [Neolewinella antarctica]NJC25797.1 nicotinate phosphoribosyltransferase [Neolewinella antarctica]